MLAQRFNKEDFLMIQGMHGEGITTSHRRTHDVCVVTYIQQEEIELQLQPGIA